MPRCSVAFRLGRKAEGWFIQTVFHRIIFFYNAFPLALPYLVQCHLYLKSVLCYSEIAEKNKKKKIEKNRSQEWYLIPIHFRQKENKNIFLCSSLPFIRDWILKHIKCYMYVDINIIMCDISFWTLGEKVLKSQHFVGKKNKTQHYPKHLGCCVIMCHYIAECWFKFFLNNGL